MKQTYIEIIAEELEQPFGSLLPTTDCKFYADCVVYCHPEFGEEAPILNGQWKYYEQDIKVDTMTLAEREAQNVIDYTRRTEHNKRLNIEFEQLHGKRPRIDSGNPDPEGIAMSTKNRVNDAITAIANDEEMDDISTLPSWFNVDSIKSQLKARRE